MRRCSPLPGARMGLAGLPRPCGGEAFRPPAGRRAGDMLGVDRMSQPHRQRRKQAPPQGRSARLVFMAVAAALLVAGGAVVAFRLARPSVPDPPAPASGADIDPAAARLLAR